MDTKPASSPPARRTRGLWFFLSMLVLAALLPLLATGGLTVWLAGEKFRATSSQRLQETALALAGAVDNGIEENIAALRLLAASSPAGLDSDGATQLWRRHTGAGAASRIVVDGASAPQQAALPAGLAAATRTLGRMQVSNLFTPASGSPPLVAIALPMPGRAAAGDVLALVQPSNDLINAVRKSTGSASDLLIAVVDSSGHLAARSRNPERYLGKPVPDWDKLRALGTDHGLFEARTAEGGRVVFAFHKLGNAPGWALVVGEPIDVFEARWKEPLRNIAIGGLIAALIALIAARIIAGRILLPVQALARRGRSVTDDEPDAPLPPPSTIREFEALRQSLVDAETALRQRAHDARRLATTLARSEHRYRTVAEAGALVFWRSNSRGELHSSTGWRDLTGQDDAQAGGMGWRQHVHRDDLAQVDIAREQIAQKPVPLDVEFRVRDVSGQWRWVRARGAKVTTDLAGNEASDEWVGVLEDVDARRQAQARIAYLAQHDTLTGLANRALLHERLGEALQRGRNGGKSALLCLDLDRFKEVNDTLGHPLGDALLRAVTARLLASVRGNDVVARLGGDEFAILQLADHQPDDASALAARLVEAVKAPYRLDGHHVVVGVSIGIVVLDRHSPHPDRLMQNADLALYRAKEEGRGRFRFFEPEMDARMQRRRQLELDLRQGMEERQFAMHYQPLVDLHSLALNGFEALLRWHHPQRGLLEPKDFLPLAEEIGLMVPLGEWVLEQACREAVQWPDHLKVAVNLAPSQLAHAGLYDMVRRVLEATGLRPQRLQLEITENALIENIEAASASLLKLKMAGVAIAMDDFGTGYSSLSYLRAFPFDKVKIDKSFVRELDQNAADGSAVISAVTHLCAKLGITATVEGVETQAQLDMIGREGCDEAQGFLFGRPIAADELPAAIARFAAARWPG